MILTFLLNDAKKVMVGSASKRRCSVLSRNTTQKRVALGVV